MKVTSELIVFVHISKTGGTTLRNILDKQYGSNSLGIYADPSIPTFNSKEKILNMILQHIHTAKSISGHFSYGMKYDHIAPEPLLSLIDTPRNISHITMLRNPVENIFSLYHHYKRNNYFNIQSSNVTFETFIKQKLYYPNYQTLRVSGTDIPDLSVAKNNIINNFSIVGITDMYNESIFLMKERFNWKDIKYQKLNHFVKTDSVQNIPNELIKLINLDNKLDFKLYTFTKQLLKQKINELNIIKRKELYEFSPFT
ncbi:sulfotransferase family 2 domain-containing protein [Bacillus toyonensis]|uniref:sulfotransferase family 2 domain-containing protein n=1 Tax=Bacillus toyonensis TaxID=155322 RepID=UPI000BFC08AB|nr:sulfotransferase family 2 domain-containing protein [Bacillus toyonensis]PHG57690.1 hypothetical protein COI59_29400 [Bacillus toyonensis]